MSHRQHEEHRERLLLCALCVLCGSFSSIATAQELPDELIAPIASSSVAAVATTAAPPADGRTLDDLVAAFRAEGGRPDDGTAALHSALTVHVER
ncbi:MAG: hypothetical protein ACAI25_12845, partial [Planctomycetota bacterium]